MGRERTNLPQDRWTQGAQIILARHHSRQTKAKMCWRSCHLGATSTGAGRGLAILALAILCSSAHWPSLTPYSLEFPFLPVHYLCLSSSFISLRQLCCNHSTIKRIPHQILKINTVFSHTHSFTACNSFAWISLSCSLTRARRCTAPRKDPLNTRSTPSLVYKPRELVWIHKSYVLQAETLNERGYSCHAK